MREIALDTQAATAVAIIEDGRVIARAHNDSGRHHAESITPLVREALQAAELPATLGGAGIDRVLVGTGPAPFTGLRAGLVSARVLARVAGVPAYGVSALDVIARQGLDLLAPDTRVYAIADARRRELYWGSYLAAGPDDVTLEGRLEVGDVASLLAAMRHAPGLVVAGAPIPAHSAPALARADLGPQIELDPAVMSRIVATRLTRGESDRLGTDPLYLRRPDIQGQPTARL
ncbi:tRNA (adenosine(37)-N6)-threonylcarbamoyltransferase complex dimerization subunit type 1 TsaB [uncultured Actinomyces sp.]|uniref:tRNA (adenosine(37)-N6)-threonylcarbamoyltransferase complex dimerization subunit type 1 TsaB n=1 Tax=uncultured Actinomyces sp. TaxID=249061 RepID=UPI002673E7BF|nr:tRNA (adenosine(37)-N6)-threonylcarbamoyltransferase complex dimerization subunit type 1 TsaB [uncultured Actinomyces sp.]